jgi:Uma2 family endonuclease
MLMATAPARWAARDLERLPDDGNRYEVVDGELFVTPSPSLDHQYVSAEFYRRIHAFVAAARIGWVFFAPGDVHLGRDNLVQPDIFVVPRTGDKRPRTWKSASKPILVVEILSDSTARRDLGPKRRLYERQRIPDYWIVDCDDRSVLTVRPGTAGALVRDRLIWHPAGADAVEIDLPALFRQALDE